MKASPIANSTAFSLLDEGAMTPEQLKRNLDLGDRVDAEAGTSAVLVSIKRAVHPATGRECYAMFGPTGTHCLSIDSDAARLHAHWRGYVENASAMIASPKATAAKRASDAENDDLLRSL